MPLAQAEPACGATVWMKKGSSPFFILH